MEQRSASKTISHARFGAETTMEAAFLIPLQRDLLDRRNHSLYL
jgi:hypothetical protein